MELDDVRSMPGEEILEALDDLKIAPGWKVADRLRGSRRVAPQPLPEPGEKRIGAFCNSIVGKVAEVVFREDHLAPLEARGYTVEDYHEAGENRDYGLVDAEAELPINVKTASTMFRKADTTVGVEPEDCIPISAYKAIGASERVPSLVYVDLVDFALREKVDAFMEGLDGPLGIGWHLLSWYAGPGCEAAQDRYVDALFERCGPVLKALTPGASQFRVISAKRVLAIMMENPRRVPGLGVKGAGTGGWNGEVNVHISVANETLPWDEVVALCDTKGIPFVLEQIALTGPIVMPKPAL